MSAANEQVDGGVLGYGVPPSIVLCRIGVNSVEWIPVDKKAPEIGQRIICTGLRGTVFVGVYLGVRDGVFGNTAHTVRLGGSNSTRVRGIEAWMPAPAPYQNLKKMDEFNRLRAAYYERRNALIFATRKKRHE